MRSTDSQISQLGGPYPKLPSRLFAFANKTFPAVSQYTLPLTTPTPPRTCISSLRAEEHGRSWDRAVYDAATVCLRDRCEAAGRGGCSERGPRSGRERTPLGITAPTARRRVRRKGAQQPDAVRRAADLRPAAELDPETATGAALASGRRVARPDSAGRSPAAGPGIGR